MIEVVHIGKIIKAELIKQRRTVSWLALQLNVPRMTCYRWFKCYSLDTHLLFRISQLLEVDFFAIYSSKLACGNNINFDTPL